MAAAKIRTIKELVATPVKNLVNLDHIIVILAELKESKVNKDEKGYFLCVRLNKGVYRSLSVDTKTTLAAMGVIVEEVENCFETDYYYQAHAKCDKNGVMEVDTSVLDELEK